MNVDPKDLVRQGYDAVSRTYRGDAADAATELRYAGWISLLDGLIEPNGDQPGKTWTLQMLR